MGAIIETDVRCTKDGQVLICHDESFKRVAAFDMKVSDISLDQVPKKYAKTFSIDFGHHSYNVKPSDQAEYCTLEQLFAAVPKT